MKKLIVILITLCLSNSSVIQANERDKEVDYAFSKLMSMLPAQGQLIHLPYADNLQTYGKHLSVKHLEDGKVTGGKVLQVEVKKVGQNPWDDGVTASIAGEINKGDVIYMMFWARASEMEEGNQSTILKMAGIQKASEPYTQLLGKDVQLDNNWKTFALAGRAGEHYTANQSQVSFQVSTARHTLEFGPVFVLNLGPEAKIEELPFLTP